MRIQARLFIPLMALVLFCGGCSDAETTTCSSYVNCAGLCERDTDMATIALLWQDMLRPGFKQFYGAMERAVDLLKEIQPEGVVSNDRLYPHVSLQYLCCLDMKQYRAAARAIRSVSWSPIDIHFDSIVCNQGGGGVESNTSFIAMVDPHGQEVLLDLVERFEDAMRTAGVPIPRPRSQQEPFHATIGVVSEGFPVSDAIAAFDAELPAPLNTDPIRIDSFLMLLPPRIFWSH